MFPVTSVSSTDIIIKLSLLPDAPITATSAVSKLSVSVEAAVATVAEPPDVAASPAETPEMVKVFPSAPLKSGVPTYELFVCTDEVMETISESPLPLNSLNGGRL